MTMLDRMPITVGQSFTLRENKITVGSGIVTKLLDPIATHKNQKLSAIDVPGVVTVAKAKGS